MASKWDTKMPKVLLISPNYYDNIFSKSKIRVAISPGTVPLGLACIAAPLLKGGHEVKIINLNLVSNQDEHLYKELQQFKPDFVGIYSTTPLIKKAYQIAAITRKTNEQAVIVAGGPHPSALPEEVLEESEIDCVVKGEGDLTLKRVVEEGFSSSIPHIYYKQDGKIIKSTAKNGFIKDLDTLPFPAYELLDIEKYTQPQITSRKKPVGYLETSRGCYAACIFCNKNIHGFKFRMKSPTRVVDEMERMLKLGFREIQIIDDVFTADMERAHTICEEILNRGLSFPWYPRGGIRVEKVDLDLLKIMKKAGCYRIPFGIESGSQRVIDVIKKKITLEQAEKAVGLTKQANLETECYFMLGLPTETEEDIKKSIDFAIKLNPDYAKFAITIPLPGTPMFDMMLAKGAIKTRDWDKYTFATSPKELYDHDVLSWDVIDRYYDSSHRKFYFRPSYLLRMTYKTLLDGTIFTHIKGFLSTNW